MTGRVEKWRPEIPVHRMRIAETKVGQIGAILCFAYFNRGQLKSESQGIGYVVQIPTLSHEDTRFITELFAEQMFPNDRTHGHERMALVFAINHMRSVQDKSAAIQERVEANDTALMRVEKIGFEWSPVWVKCSSDSPSTCKHTNSRECKPIPFEKVREIYNACVRYNHDAALCLRSREEGIVSKEKMIPYAHLLETLAQSEQTKRCVKRLRMTRTKRPVYLLFQHAQVIRLNAIGHAYDTLLKTQRRAHKCFPMIASTGYGIDSKIPLLNLAADLDRLVRYAIHQAIPFGPYPPEPNVALKVTVGSETLGISFIRKDTPREMLAYISNMMELYGGKDPQELFAFDATNPVILKSRPRMDLYGKTRSLKQFAGRLNRSGKIVRWTHQDIKHWSGLSQTHIKPCSWAKQVIRAFEREFTGCRNQLHSAAAAIFSACDPVGIARDSEDFVETLTEQLTSYDSAACTRKARRIAHKKLAPEFEKIGVEHSRAVEISDLVVLAAKNSGLVITNLLSQKLCLDFHERCWAIAEDFFPEASEGQHGPVHEAILTSSLPQVKNNELDVSKIRRMIKEQPRGDYNMTALHLAALVGDAGLVEFLIEKLGQNVDIEADEGIYPFHLAFEHCRDFEMDFKLLRLLCSEKSVNSKVGDVPFIIYAMERLDESDALDVVTLLVQNGCDLNVFSSDDELTPLEIASEMGWHQVFKYILAEDQLDLDQLYCGDLLTSVLSTDGEFALDLWKHLEKKGKSLKDVLDGYDQDIFERFRSLTGINDREDAYHPDEIEEKRESLLVDQCKGWVEKVDRLSRAEIERWLEANAAIEWELEEDSDGMSIKEMRIAFLAWKILLKANLAEPSDVINVSYAGDSVDMGEIDYQYLAREAYEKFGTNPPEEYVVNTSEESEPEEVYDESDSDRLMAGYGSSPSSSPELMDMREDGMESPYQPSFANDLDMQSALSMEEESDEELSS